MHSINAHIRLWDWLASYSGIFSLQDFQFIIIRWPADEIREFRVGFETFKVLYRLNYSGFYFVCYHSNATTVLELHFGRLLSSKAYFIHVNPYRYYLGYYRIRPTSGRKVGVVNFPNTEYRCANTNVLFQLWFIHYAMHGESFHPSLLPFLFDNKRKGEKSLKRYRWIVREPYIYYATLRVQVKVV